MQIMKRDICDLSSSEVAAEQAGEATLPVVPGAKEGVDGRFGESSHMAQVQED